MTDPVINEAGMVAMKYRRQVPIQVKCQNYTYAFVVRANIPMTWAHPEHVPCLLAVKGGCCGGNKKPGIITYANESDVRRWTNNGGR